MDTQTSTMAYKTEVDNGIRLPFQLSVNVGGGKYKEEIKIDKLTSNPQNVHKYLYEIKELKDLTIKLNGSFEKSVKVLWGDIKEKDSEKVTFPFVLNRKNPSYCLYTINGTDQYPWRCGTYHFEVEFDGRKYLGSFRVTSKNINEKQFSKIHELINMELEGLAIDYVSRKKTYGVFTDIEESGHWKFVKWYLEIEKKLLMALKSIEVDSQREPKKVYQIENEPKNIDGVSVRWENTTKGQGYKGSKYLNKKFIQHCDTDINRLVKYRLLQLLKKMRDVSNFLDNIKMELESYNNRIHSEVITLRKKIKVVNQVKPVTDRDKQRIKDTLLAKEKDLENTLEKLGRYKNITLKFINSQKTLSARISSGFWNSVKYNLPGRICIERKAGYQIFQKIWDDSRGVLLSQGLKPIEIPVYKSTSELYEYYVLFGVINVFKELNFMPFQDSVTEQLLRTFFEDGLKDGSNVFLVRDSIQIVVTYDEMVAHNADSALDNQTNFYSAGRNRKPDLRLDCYHKHQDNWEFSSSFIIEVKYSPFHNIHNRQGRTRAMEQMSEYWRIMYVDKKEGIKKFNRQVVHDVICIYPGTVNQALIFSDDFGTFLQFYPAHDKEDLYDIVGKNELKSMIIDWLNLGNQN